jgi:predicted TIM-barrel fold metal-dependent hydrolase
MSPMNRRDLLAIFGAAALGQTAAAQQSSPTAPLPVDQYEPKSMLHAKETRVPRAKYPVIDWHTHITGVGGLNGPGRLRWAAKPEECLAVMDRKNIQTMVDVTGGYGDNLKEAVEKLSKAHPGRFVVFTEPAWSRAAEPDFPKIQADLIQQAHDIGARGLKCLKTLGLYLRDKVTTGALVKVDDKRFDPMWEAAAALNMPIAIHTSDPEAFFVPIDKYNERYEELHAHPDWSFHGKDFPSNRELQEARRNVMRRHPKTQFVCLHVADSEDLPYVSECLDAHPNMNVDIAARIGELGRQPRASRKFIEKYQDRVLFGTDASPNSTNVPQQLFGDALYEIYYRFLETDDEYFPYAPAAKPPQGRWNIYGIALPDGILKKVYHDNAARLLRI